MEQDAFHNDTPEQGIPDAQPQETPDQPPLTGATAAPSSPPPYNRTVPPAAPRRNWIWPVAIAIGCLPWIILSLIVFGLIIAGLGQKPRHGQIALIHVSGVITGGGSNGGVFGESASGSEDLISQLEDARRSKRVKAVVIRINSPGGSAAGSEEVYNEVMRIRRDGKPVYTSMGDVAASGGYYIASASNKIYADVGTITGSIGVIFETVDMSNLYKKIGFNPEVVKSGKFKDIGSPARPLTPAERQLLQGIIDSTYQKFVDCVAKGRKLPVSEVKAIADGRIFTGSQARRIKLVDEIGGLHETIRAAAKSVGIKGEPKVVEYTNNSWFSSLFEGDSGNTSSQVGRAITDKMLRQLLSKENSVPALK